MSSGSITLQNGDKISFNYKCIFLLLFVAAFYGMETRDQESSCQC